ncbi:MAG: alpha/beta hydrolase, partial [Cyanobacteria bacterium P01_E01_bin.45]
ETFNNLARVRQLKRPLLVAHGRQDTVIPFRHGQRLFEAATVPKFFLDIPNAGHLPLLLAAPGQYIPTLDEFVAALSTDS